MSTEDAETVRGLWRTLAGSVTADESALDEIADRTWDPDAEYREDPKWPGSGSYRGLDKVREVWKGYLDVFGEARMEVEDVIDAGDRCVALVRISGHSSAADVPFDHVWGYVCRVRDGRFARVDSYWDPDEALAAAGVDSP